MGNEVVSVGIPALVVGVLAFRWLLRPLRPARLVLAAPLAPTEAIVDLRSPAPSWSVPAGPQVPVRIRVARAAEVPAPGADDSDVVAACA